MTFPNLSYTQFLELMPDAALVVDAGATIVLTNAQADALFGYERGELEGQPIHALVPEPQAARDGRPAERVGARAGQPVAAGRSLTARRKDGAEFPADVVLRPVEFEGGWPFTICVVRDATHRVHLEAALRQSEEQYRLLVENASEVFYQVAIGDDLLRGQVAFVSQQAEMMTGHHQADFVRQPDLWLKCLHPEDIGHVFSTTAAILESRVPGTREYRIWDTRQQGYRWVEDRVVPQFSTGGAIAGYQGVARDVTARKEKEAELERLYEQIRRDATELAHAYDTTIQGWSHALELRDNETKGHTLRVTEMTLRVARAAGMTEEELIQIRRGALLHDIGKIGIPDDILFKNEELTADEWAVVREHPNHAHRMLSPITYLSSALDIPYCHHEHWDGSGYPRGLRGEEIPLAARLFAVVDVWDALRSNRPYHAGRPDPEVIEHLRSRAGTQFDPWAVELFLDVLREDARA